MNPRARDVVARLQRAGFTAYLAGGCVRDQLLGIEAKDCDVATSATAEEVQRVFSGRVTDLVGKSFGVVRVREGEEFFEVAMFRQDGAYIDGRHPTSVTPATPEEDAQRRDFTINGMFYDPIAEKLIDYVGGEADLKAGIIRAIGNPEHRFHEDHLRLLRAIRFAARFGFQIEQTTWEAIKAGAAMIRTVSAERVRDELNRIFTVAKPERGAGFAGPERTAGAGAAGHRGAARRGAASAVSSGGGCFRAYAADADEGACAGLGAGAGDSISRRGEEADGEEG